MREEKPKTFKLQKNVSVKQRGITAIVGIILGLLLIKSVIGLILFIVGFISGIFWVVGTIKNKSVKKSLKDAQLDNRPADQSQNNDIEYSEFIDSGKDAKCPHCAELIKKEAKKCKHCGSKIDTSHGLEMAKSKNVIIFGAFVILIAVFGIINNSQYNKSVNFCREGFKGTVYQGRTSETKSQIAEINNTLQAEHNENCNAIYQPGISYLFSNRERRISAERICQSKADLAKANVDSPNSGIESTVLGKVTFDRNTYLSQCMLTFGF